MNTKDNPTIVIEPSLQKMIGIGSIISKNSIYYLITAHSTTTNSIHYTNNINTDKLYYITDTKNKLIIIRGDEIMTKFEYVNDIINPEIVKNLGIGDMPQNWKEYRKQLLLVGHFNDSQKSIALLDRMNMLAKCLEGGSLVRQWMLYRIMQINYGIPLAKRDMQRMNAIYKKYLEATKYIVKEA